MTNTTNPNRSEVANFILHQLEAGHVTTRTAVDIIKCHAAQTPTSLPDIQVELLDHQVQLHGSGVWDFDSLVNMMDDEIRELVHYEANKQEMSNQQFLDAYCKHHFAKHHEEFMI